MTRTRADERATAVSGGDGSLAGPAIGGSVTGPDAGVIQDPVGPEVAIPVTTDPGDEPARIDPSVEPATAEREADDPTLTSRSEEPDLAS